MKLKTLIATTLVLSTFMANASCFKTYQEKLIETKQYIDNSNYDRVRTEAAILMTATNVAVISGLSGSGGPLVSTTAGAGLIASLYMGATYIELRMDNTVEEALARQQLLESGLAVLREAKAGYGHTLVETVIDANRTISTAISLKNLSDKINEQSRDMVYCQNPDQLMSPAGILKTALEELKREL